MDPAEGPDNTDAPTSGTSPTPAQSTPTRGRRTLPLFTSIVLIALALVVGYLLGRPSHPIDSSADAGFLRDMSVHHTQAVDMSLLILEKTEDEQLRAVATDIARTQQSQVGRMHGWLVQWDLPIRGSQPQMAWMEGHGHGVDSGEPAPEEMPGYIDADQMDELAEATGVEAEILYLELMIEHHEGGVEMAEVARVLADEPYVVDLAHGMEVAQEAEIELLESMVDDRTD
ncbi:DUF305 domain-containing protein [Lipingzhangella sp. LS1_29]|uniref:DUF305 domain-containing protein n=1 Tax=Lipingzhangella rawalii TaxID=2055835 RepID=A0ABU2H5S2_9ACTN|nr:DUF305 domain-containing protein [Lipingzhangella rawalii]